MKLKVSWQAFWALFFARNKEFYRDKGTLVWNFAFPILVVLGFSLIFNGNKQNLFKVALQSARPATEISALDLPQTEFVAVQEIEGQNGAISKLKRHQYDLVVSVGKDSHELRYWVNASSPKGQILERLFVNKHAKREIVEGKEIRYVDWVVAGLLGMNIMFSALFGVGYVIVRYRKNGVLKRLKATPVHARTFILAQISSRLALILISTTLVFLGIQYIIHFDMQGSYALLFVVYAVGAFCLIALGLLVASRLHSEEFAGGLLNALSWPMMFLSGVWFSLEGSPEWVKKIALALPLTHVVDASRAIMTEGAGWTETVPHIAVLGILGAIFVTLGAVLFRWD